jgi:tRNA A-37 threonylcarbamoyl transferase component Bud32
MTLEQDKTVGATLAGDPGERDGEVVEGVADMVQRLGRFRVLGKLGEGGMGVVLSAHDEQLDRQVALKLLTRARHDAVAHERLIREARSLARLSHPNIVSVHEVGESEGTPYLVMELVVGQTLRQWLDGDGEHQPSRLEILRMFLAIGRGLSAAHELAVVHRDFKPDNVLVGHDGRARVVDFGLARVAHAGTGKPEDELVGARPVPGEHEPSLTATGALMGTPAYMAPEQWLGKPADARSDQFSFCVALFQAIYGHAPFAGTTMAELMVAVLEEAPAPVRTSDRLPGALHEAIMRGLDKQPERRWPAMEPLLQLLESTLVSAPPGMFDGRPPVAAMAMLPLFAGIPVGLITLELSGLVAYTAVNWAIASGAQILLLLMLVLALRKRLLALVNDRRVLAMPFLITLFIVGHRAIAFASGSSYEVMFAYDFLTAIGIGAIMTFLVDRRAWPVIVLNVVLLVLALAQPAWAPRLWLAFTLGMPAVGGASLTRTRDRLRGDTSRSGTSRPGSMARPSSQPE